MMSRKTIQKVLPKEALTSGGQKVEEGSKRGRQNFLSDKFGYHLVKT